LDRGDLFLREGRGAGNEKGKVRGRAGEGRGSLRINSIHRAQQLRSGWP